MDQPATTEMLLAFSEMQSQDPEATVVMYPAEHLLYSESAFVPAVKSAVRLASSHPDLIMLLAIPAARWHPDYGSLRTGNVVGSLGGHRLLEVLSIAETPPAKRLTDQMGQALCNTLILVGKVSKFWNLAWFCMPEFMARFEQYREALGTKREQAALEQVHPEARVSSFFQQLLSRIPERILALEIQGAIRSTLGDPRATLASLSRLGKVVSPAPL